MILKESKNYTENKQIEDLLKKLSVTEKTLEATKLKYDLSEKVKIESV